MATETQNEAGADGTPPRLGEAGSESQTVRVCPFKWLLVGKSIANRLKCPKWQSDNTFSDILLLRLL
jgi:hypothetical protein